MRSRIHELPGPGEVGAEQPAKEVLGEVPRTHVQGERCAAVDSVLSFANLSVVLGPGGASRRTPPCGSGRRPPGALLLRHRRNQPPQ